MATYRPSGIVGEEAGHASNIRLPDNSGRNVSLSARPMTVPPLTRVAAYGTVALGLASLVNQHSFSYHAYSLYTTPLTQACHRLEQDFDSDTMPKGYCMFCDVGLS